VFDNLLKLFNDLREILMHKLLTTPEEDQERIAYISEIAKRERQHALTILKLEGELQDKNNAKEDEVTVLRMIVFCLFVILPSEAGNFMYCFCVRPSVRASRDANMLA
jgi:hypothetical protein